MGFFDSLTGASKGQTGQTSATGFRAWPTWMQDVYRDVGKGVQNTLFTGEGQPNAELFTPMSVTGDEGRAFDAMRQGFAPTPETLGADISMFQNPYNEHVINEINRQSGGEYSILKQAMTDAGQFGSNRQMLGANDIDLTRTGQIGRFLQDQFNNSMGYAMTMPGYRAADAEALLGIGGFERGLDLQTKQAPVAALMAAGQTMNPLGTVAADPGRAAGTTTVGGSQGDLFTTLGNVGKIAAGISTFSDRRLKENIQKIREENGFNIYEFNYIDNPQKYTGVMADEVKEIMPDAVGERDGYMTVNYPMIGVEFNNGTF